MGGNAEVLVLKFPRKAVSTTYLDYLMIVFNLKWILTIHKNMHRRLKINKNMLGQITLFRGRKARSHLRRNRMKSVQTLVKTSP